MTDQRRPVLALDIGGTKLAVAVVTEDGATHGLSVEPTRRDEGPDRISRRLFAMGRAAIAAAGLGPVSAVGISCGGPLNAATGVLESPLHLPGWVDVPIVALAEQEFGIPAVLENDATAAALGEFRYGAGVGISTLLYLTISTGIGGGAVIDGRLHRGAAGNGGEYGHIMVRPGGRACLCGRRGCLEAYASGSSIAARATDALSSSAAPASTLRALPTVQAQDVAAAAAAGDAIARALWDETTQLLSVAITDLVNVVEPDLVVLGGGVTRAGDALLQPIKTQVLSEAMRPAASVVRIELAGLGDVVCAVGAAALAFDLIDAGSAAKATASGGSGTETEERIHV
jgi:glucokinase